MLSETSPQPPFPSQSNQLAIRPEQPTVRRLSVFLWAVFLVSIPVFIQAPLVRIQPWVSLSITLIWLMAGFRMLRQPHLDLWGDLAIGFSWTWLAGSLYWGWLRENPYVHLPVEAIGLPIVIILLSQNRLKVGSYFFLGSLLGTAITDIYFYWVDLIPYWQQVMQVDPDAAGLVLRSALIHIENPLAIMRALILLAMLILVGTLPLRSTHHHWWAFSGAVLSTILVDALFLAAAIAA